MDKKYISLAAVCLMAVALLPGFAFASNSGRDDNFDNNDRGGRYNGDRSNYDSGNRNYQRANTNYENDINYRADYGYGDNHQRTNKNSAAYSDYVNNSYYEYSNNQGCNCGCNCNNSINDGYMYYNPAPGATNYTRPIISNCRYQNQNNYTNYNRYRYQYN